MSTEIEPPLYQSATLTSEVKKWVNIKKIKQKNYLAKDDFFNAELKKFTAELLKKKDKSFEFNKKSIFFVLDQIWA